MFKPKGQIPLINFYKFSSKTNKIYQQFHEIPSINSEYFLNEIFSHYSE